MFARLVSNIPRLLSNAMMIMFARLLSARFGQDMDKPLATDVLKTKMKISLFIILFTDYCLQSRFTFTIYDTVHSEFLPI